MLITGIQVKNALIKGCNSGRTCHGGPLWSINRRQLFPLWGVVVRATFTGHAIWPSETMPALETGTEEPTRALTSNENGCKEPSGERCVGVMNNPLILLTLVVANLPNTKWCKNPKHFIFNFATNAVFYFPVFHSIHFLVTHNTLIILFVIPYLHYLNHIVVQYTISHIYTLWFFCKNPKNNEWNPGKWVLIWEYSGRAF